MLLIPFSYFSWLWPSRSESLSLPRRLETVCSRLRSGLLPVCANTYPKATKLLLFRVPGISLLERAHAPSRLRSIPHLAATALPAAFLGAIVALISAVVLFDFPILSPAYSRSFLSPAQKAPHGFACLVRLWPSPPLIIRSASNNVPNATSWVFHIPLVARQENDM